MVLFNLNNATKLQKPFIDTTKLIEKMELWDGKAGEWIKFKLWDIQKEILYAIHNYKYVILLKKRQIGGTQLFMADTLALSMVDFKLSTLFLSVGQAESNIALERGDGMFQRLPDQIKSAAKYKKTTEKIVIGDTDSWIKSLTASNGRSSTAKRVGIDEAAFMTPKEAHIELQDVLRNVTPVIDQTDGQLVIISTANGVGNEYQRIFMEAVKGNNNFCAVFISCWDDPGFTPEKRANLIKDFGEQSVNQEYPRTYTEAFLASGSPRFDMKSVERYLEHVINPIMTGHLDKSGVEPNENGSFNVYQKRKKYSQYLVVADVGEGVGGDPSVAKVYNRITQEQIAEWHGQLEPSKFGTILSILGTIYNNAIIVVEANNHGHSTLNTLVNQENYPSNLVFTHDEIMKERPDDDFNRGMVRYGWRTTNTTRPIIINNMATMLVDGTVMQLNISDVNELQSFVIKNGKAQAESGCHDDRVMVMCIAQYLMNNDTFNTFYKLRERKTWENCSICTNCNRSDEAPWSCSLTNRGVGSDDWCSSYEMATYDHQEYLADIGMADESHYVPMGRLDNED